MMASRGMGAISSSKMPKGKKESRRDDTDFTEYADGGMAQQAAIAISMKKEGKKPKKMAAGGELKEVPEDNTGLSKLPTEVRNKMGYMKSGGGVNAAGNYTKPSLRKRIVAQVKAAATQGTGAGQWSARKAQLVAKRYKAAGGSYRD
jgi:hypothetical protein